MVEQAELNKISLIGLNKIILGDYTLLISNLDSNVGIWHPKKEFSIHYKGNIVFGFNIHPMLSGCGVVVIYNIYSNINGYGQEGVIQILKTIFYLYKKDGAGTLLTTYGETYRDTPSYKLFLEVGFKVISTYKNWRHGGKEQDLLQLITE